MIELDELYDNEMLKRESGGDNELFELIVQREVALETYLDQKDIAKYPDTFFDEYTKASEQVRQTKNQKGIQETVYWLESDS